MKKLIIILIFTLLLTACSRIPSGMNKQTYDIGCTALDIIHRYNAAEINIVEAEERIRKLKDKLEVLKFEGSEKTNNNFVYYDLSFFLLHKNSYDVEEDLKKHLGK